MDKWQDAQKGQCNKEGDIKPVEHTISYACAAHETDQPHSRKFCS
ncbi:hypothetical protein GCM10010911_49740 [Paenibacillus nasutitermitis]|uniref:Uncharacterized protein n=1 Tax=Paenibacillus nasutitermitis TaxID=1652958 RepID=A0A916ZB90_9BACL|nr:hypothetical protein GCM10010911_49740 [Paenibacillus nasutitermitis]